MKFSIPLFGLMALLCSAGAFDARGQSVSNLFPIALDTLVSNGVPVTGAGNLESAGSWDDYVFTAPANRSVFFDVVTAFDRLRWTLTGPNGEGVFTERYMPFDDTRRVELPGAGTYRLRVYNDRSLTGTYAFKLNTITDQVFTIVVGDTVTNNVPAAGAGNLETPGAFDDYLFAAPPNRLVFFDVITAVNRLRWSLIGPNGEGVFNDRYMPFDDTRRVELPTAGIYRLRVYNDQDLTGSYSFKLWPIADQSFALNVGDTVTNGVPAAGAGHLEGPGAFDDYRFEAPGSRVVFFDVHTAFNRLWWTLAAPDGSTVFTDHMPNNNTRRVELPAAGSYRLRVYNDQDGFGVYSFKVWAVTDQSFGIAVGSVVTNGAPTPGAGRLESPGAEDVYSFAANAGQRVRFDDRDAAPRAATWRLMAPGGVQLFQDNLDGNDPATVTLPTTGTYIVQVTPVNAAAPVNYSFALVDSGTTNVPASTAQSFALAIGDVITNGAPALGAGNLETNSAQDIYTFTATPGQTVFFEDRGSSNHRNLRYDVYDELWTLLFGEWIGNDQEVGRRILIRGGVYRIVVTGFQNNNTGTYSLRLWNVPAPDSGVIGFSPGAPGSAAGAIETPGARDVWTFNAVAGQAVFFEDRGSPNHRNLRYDVYDPQGALLFGEWIGNDQEVGRQVLNRAGEYRIVVSGFQHQTGAYSLRLWNVADPVIIPIAIGNTVGTNMPVAGAGQIEAPGNWDVFTFTNAPGQKVFFDSFGNTPSFTVRWTAIDARGTRLFDEWLTSGDPSGRELTVGGTNTILVYGSGNSTAAGYGFKIWSSPAPQRFTLAVGDTIPGDLTTPGVGRIETPGAFDVLTFTNAPGQTIFFDSLGSTPAFTLRWTVIDAAGTRLFDEWLTSGDPGSRTLSQCGTNQILVYGPGDNVGSYGLRLWNVPPPDRFAIPVGQTVADGFPTAGAGRIETPGVEDLYEFSATPGQVVFFDDRGGAGGIDWQLLDDTGVQLFRDRLDNGSEPGNVTLTRGGVYTIRVFGLGDASQIGPYSFKLWTALPYIVRQPQDSRGVAAESQTFSVVAESQTPLAYQWRFNGANLPSATNAVLRLASPSLAQAGGYDVIVSNAAGAVTSRVATLTLDGSQLYVTEFAPLGPVRTNVDQFRVAFNSTINGATFNASDVVLRGPSGVVNGASLQFGGGNQSAYTVTFPTQTAEGRYTVEIGPNIANLSGQTMTGGLQPLAYATDFENGAGPEWSGARLTTNDFTSRFLGQYDNQSVTLTLPQTLPYPTLRLTWDALILDSWDGNNGPGPDYFGFHVAGLPEPRFEHTFCNFNNYTPQTFPGFPTVGGFNFIQNGGFPDSIYQQLQHEFRHTNQSLVIRFYGRGLQGVGDESWGLDNVRVQAVVPSNGVFTGSFVIDRTGAAITNISVTGTSAVPVAELTLTFNESVQAASFTVGEIQLTGPLGVIAVNPPQRLDANTFRLTFPSQRRNGAYTLGIGPQILDDAGNAMNQNRNGVNGEASDRFTASFSIFTPPLITTQPASRTIVRNNDVAFSVVADGTPTVTYQWDFNGAPLDGATNATLTLNRVEPNQSGAYRVSVTDSGGTTVSGVATLTVLPTYGPFIAASQAAPTGIPPVAGDGVAIELFNAIGGGPAPTPELVANRAPDGTTLSPVIDFPRPGVVINVGNSFNTFFANTTIPPEQVSGLSAQNFVLRIAFWLRVTANMDLHPETPEIDLQLGVGSDDGFHLLVGTNFLGSAGDRGFTYSWMDVSFQDAGLYPVTLHFAANAVGQSGLELSWNTATSGGNQIIPQSALYITPNPADRLITFEEFPAGTVVSNQFAAQGVLFRTLSADLRIMTNSPTRFVPVSPRQVLGDPNSNPARTGIVEITFVTPGTDEPATTSFASFYVLDAEATGASVTAFNSRGDVLFADEYHGGGAAQELVGINRPGIAKLRITLGQGSDTAALDNFAFLTPVSLPDLVVDAVTAPTNAVAGQPIQLMWRVSNLGTHVARGPWSDAIALSADLFPGGDTPLGAVTYTNDLIPGASLIVTQTVILPASVAGDRYLVITTDSASQVQESGSVTNNSVVVTPSLRLVAPDLVVDSARVAPSAQFGQTLSVTWTVRNAGGAVANGNWSDRLLLSTDNQRGGDTLLTTLPANASPLAPGGSYTRSADVTLPINASLSPGNYFVLVVADIANDQPESNEGNNVAAAPIALSVPPLPDLAVAGIQTPSSGIPGQPVALTWAVTNRGSASANGSWVESVFLSSDAAIGADQLVARFQFTNALPAGASLSRTEPIVLPVLGVSGALRFVVELDSDNVLAEQNEANNAALSADTITVAPSLTLYLPVTNIAENASNPNLTALVTRNGGLTSPLTITLTSADTSELTAPATVTIGAGQSSVSFDVTVQPDGIPDADQTVILTAAATSYATARAAITVRNSDAPRLLLMPASGSVVEGQTLAATLTREGANGVALSVTLVSSSASQLLAPALVVIPAGSNSVTIGLQAVDDSFVEPARVYRVEASAPGYTATTTDLTVTDNDVPVVRLALSATNASEGAGPQAVMATVSRLGSTVRSLTLAFESSDLDTALVPATVTIRAGATNATFFIAAVDNAQVNAPKTVVIRSFVLDSLDSARVAEGTNVSLTITDDDGPSLRVEIDRELVAEGLSRAARVTISRNTGNGGTLVVSLASSDTSEATVPTSATIPAGQSSVTVDLASVNDGVPDGNQVVTITASSPGFASGSETLTVSDVDLPDLIVSRVQIPSAADADAFFNVTYRVVNQGLAAAPSNFLTRVFLSKDAVIGDDTLLGQFVFGGAIPPRQFFEQTLQVRAPSAVGDCWVLVETDAGNQIAEGLENNNATISATPIRVGAAYRATVQTAVNTAPAGTPVVLTGRALRLGSATPAPFALVNIHLTVRGTRRIISALTDANGDYSTTFLPLPGEAGRYEVGADHPGVAVTAAQDSFVLLGLRVAAVASVRVAEGESVNGTASVENLSDLPLSGLAVSVFSAPPGLTVVPSLSANALPGDGRIQLGYAITVPIGVTSGGVARLHLTTAEGAIADVELPIRVNALTPRLVAEPGELVVGLRRGRQQAVEFVLSNQGGATSGPVTISLPPLPWLSVASTNPLASLAPGESNVVTLLLFPPVDAPLSQFDGSLVLTATGASLPVPVHFRVLSEDFGDLKIQAVDEYTYFAAGAPPVAGARVTVRDALSQTVITNGVTDANGILFVPRLREAYYTIEAEAEKHHGFHDTVLVAAGQTNTVTTFLPRETVTYNWTVEPTEIEDRTRLTVETVFEVNVPAPVVTLMPARIDLQALTFVNGQAQVDFTLENHGLIAAQDVALRLPNHPRFEFRALVTEIGVLPAKSKLTIPVTISLKRGVWPSLPGADLARSAFNVTAAAPPARATAPFTSPTDGGALTLGTPVTGTLQPGQSVLYMLFAPDGQTVQIDLDSQANSGANALYLRARQVPETNAYDHVALAPEGPDRRLFVPDSIFGTNYVLIHAANVSSAAGYTLTARALPFGLRQVSSTRLGTTGEASILIEGAGFNVSTHVELTRGTNATPAASVEVIDGSRIWATFDLRNALAADYQLHVFNEVLTYQVDEAAGEVRRVVERRGETNWPAVIRVVAGGAGRLMARVGALTRTAVPSIYEVPCVLRNEGEVDLPLPVVQIAGQPGLTLSTRPDFGDAATSELFLAVYGPRQRPVLGPGQEVEVRVWAKTSLGPDFQLSVRDVLAQETPITWKRFESFYRDAHGSRNWDTTWAAFKADVGSSVAGLRQAMARVAPDVWTSEHDLAVDADRFILRLLDQAARGDQSVAARPVPAGISANALSFVLRPELSPGELASDLSAAAVAPPAWLLKPGLGECLNRWGQYSDRYMNFLANAARLDMNGIFRAQFGSQAVGVYLDYLSCSGGSPCFGNGDDVVEGRAHTTGFANSTTTKDMVKALMAEAKNRIRQRYSCRNLPSRIAVTTLFSRTELEQYEGMLNYNRFFTDTAAFLAGNIGSSGRLCQNDTRRIEGDLLLEKKQDDCGNVLSVEIDQELMITVNDSIDFCPGGTLGGGVIGFVLDLVPMQILEANGRACAVPFKAKFKPDVDKDRLNRSELRDCRTDCCSLNATAPYCYPCGGFMICRAAQSSMGGSGDAECAPSSPSSGGGNSGTGAWFSYGGGGGCSPSGPPVLAASTQAIRPIVPAAGAPGVCARVRLRTDQSAVITRDAFSATLEINNAATTPLTDVAVDLVIQDARGQLATELFGLRPPSLTTLTAVDGSGSLSANMTGRANWILIPTSDAAPEVPVQYFVSGSLRYRQDGLSLAVPLAPAPITVHPNPRLFVKYFHQRDVFSDDPFTPQIEPAIPYSLGIMIENRGRGVAKNVRITSAQPAILENEKGLLIGFNLIATEVSGQNLTPSLTANFGHINSRQIALARWLFTSTLQGQFIDYKASFEHLDGLGNKKLSLIESVEIHEMIHLVQAAGAQFDGKWDFLVNDETNDLRHLPDTLYFSDGGIAPVSVMETASASGVPAAGSLEVQLTAPPFGGWTYLRVPDPGQGRWRLAAVRRSDGTNLLADNFWQTDRTFVGMGRRPVSENILHLLDAESSGSYTLVYAAPSATDTNPPSSRIAPLPAQSYPQIPVTWSGDDPTPGSGIATYDVYVSINGGAFAPWLRDVAQLGATYAGVPGNTYAFYSQATDAAGNREVAPFAPDAQTAVTLSNASPMLALIAPRAIDEGTVLALTLEATDSDRPAQSLRFSLGADAPPGMVLDPNTGTIRWSTGEGNGPSTNRITVHVRDNGVPSLTDSATFTVIISEVNTAPTLAAILDRTIDEGRLLLVTNRATDVDIPAQTLSYRLGSGAPLGASVDAITGIFRWQPSSVQGGTTNTVTIVVSDDGAPSLSATQSFRVVVRDVLPDVVLELGTTNLLAGESGSVPITFTSGRELANVAFTLEVSAPSLNNLRVQAVAPSVGSATIQAVASNRFFVRLEARAGESLTGRSLVAALLFDTGVNVASAIVPLHPSAVVGTTTLGLPLSNARSSSGRVFLVSDRPLLDALMASNGQRSVVLYGLPGHQYTLESTPRLSPPVSWTNLTQLSLSGRSTTIVVPPVTGTVFYHARELGGFQIGVRRSGEAILIAWPPTSEGLVLETTSTLSARPVWLPVTQPATLIGDTMQVNIPISPGARYFRLRPRR